MKLASYLWVAVCLVIVSASPPADAKELKFQTVFSPSDVYMKNLEHLGQSVKTASNGRLTLKFFPVKAVVGITGTLDAIKAGIIDGQVTWPGFWGGQEPAFTVLGDFSGAYLRPHQQMEAMEAFGGLALLRKLYAKHGIYTVGLLYAGAEALTSREPIGSIAALKGVKIRVPPGIASNTFAKLGAVPVSLPLVEAFSALDKGVVDVADYQTLTANARQGMYNKAKFAVYPSPHGMPLFDVSLSQRRWQALSPDLQRLLKMAVREAATRTIFDVTVADAKTARELTDKHGVTVVRWSAADVSKFRQAARTVWQEYAARSPMAKRAVELQTDYLKLHGLLSE